MGDTFLKRFLVFSFHVTLLYNAFSAIKSDLKCVYVYKYVTYLRCKLLENLENAWKVRVFNSGEDVGTLQRETDIVLLYTQSVFKAYVASKDMQISVCVYTNCASVSLSISFTHCGLARLEI